MEPCPGRTDIRISFFLGGLALLVRLLHLHSLTALPTFASPIMDEAYQSAWAQRIASGDWLGQDVFFRAPLHAYALAAVYALLGTSGLAPRVVQCLAGSVAVVLLHRIGLRVAGPRPAAVAAFMMALCWPLIHFDNALLTVGLEVFLALLAILILLWADAGGRDRPFRWLAGGVALGLAALARPNMLAFAAAAIAWAAWPRAAKRPGSASVLWIALGIVVAVLPVTARNYVVGHDLVLIASQGGVNFFIGNNALADGTTAVVPGTRPTWQGGYEDAIAIAREAEGAGLRPSGVSRYWYRRGLAFWRQDPIAAARLLARKAILFLGGVEISNNEDLTFFRAQSPILSLPLPGAALLAPLGVLGWIVAWRRRPARRREMALPILFALAYGASIIAFFVNSRYRAPVLPVLAIGSGLLLEELIESWKIGSWRAVAVMSSSAAVLILALNLNPFGYRDDPGQGHLSLGLSLHQAGRLQEALERYDRAIAAGGPYTYEALHRKAEALIETGRTEEALAALRISLEMRPLNGDAMSLFLDVAASSGRYPEARDFALRLARGGRADADIHFAVGSMDQRLGDAAQSEERYRAALTLDPDHLGARVNLALLLRAAGRLDESLRELLAAEQSHPGAAVVHLNLSKHYLFLGRRDEAVAHASIAESLGGTLDPEFAEALAGHGGMATGGKSR